MCKVIISCTIHTITYHGLIRTCMHAGVSLGTVFTMTDRINPCENEFGSLYMITGNRNTEIEFTEIFWFGSTITPIKTENTELPY